MKLSSLNTTAAAFVILIASASSSAQQPSAIAKNTGTAGETAVSAVTPAVTTATNVTTVTGGTKGTIPMFTTSNNIENSTLYYNTTGLGIGRFPAGMLDVNGKAIIRGSLDLSRSGDATTTTGYPSNPFFFQASVYNSTYKASLLPYFQLQTSPVGNNTATTGGTLDFLYFSGVGSAPAETGLYINGNGNIHFAPTQTFPITQGPQGPTGPQGLTGPAGPSGPIGPSGATSPQVWTSTTLLQPFTDNVAQFGTVMGGSDGLTGSDFYSQYRRSLIFPNACTASNFNVNFGFESVSSPFVMETDLLVNSNVALSCSTGFSPGTGVGFNCVAAGTYPIPAGAQVVLKFSHTGTNPSNVYPQVTFSCQ